MKKLFLIFALCALIVSCTKNHVKNNVVDGSLISEITSENISRSSQIVIHFINEIKNKTENAFSFSRTQKGSWDFPDTRTALFTPVENYKADEFTLYVNYKMLFNTDTNENNFSRTFFVEPKTATLEFGDLYIENGAFHLTGVLKSNDEIKIADAKKTIKANLNGKSFSKKVNITWNENSEKSAKQFSLSGENKTDERATLILSWNGNALSLSKKQNEIFSGEKKYEIAGANEFVIASVDQSNNEKIVIAFSDTISQIENIKNFIEVKSANENYSFTYSIDENVLTLYSDAHWKNVSLVKIRAGLESANGKMLSNDFDIPIKRNWDIPEARFANDGIILPTTQNTTLTIETKNLSAVSVVVYEIYENNMLQFLQQNNFDGKWNLEHVADAIYKKKFTFNWNDDMQNKFISRGIDLSELSKKYPHGMFRLKLGFSKDDIHYVGDEKDFSHFPFPPDLASDENESDYYEALALTVSQEDRWNFWNERENPTHPAFYQEWYSDHFPERNILVSDIALTAKKTESEKVFVVASDLKTAKPISGISISLFSNVNQLIAKKTSDANGSVIFENTKNAAVVVAENSAQASYLKLADGLALSMSHFDVAGEKVQNGAKGFIYGERGVWRPGDAIFLTFVLQDETNKIPSDFPIFFSLTDSTGKIIDEKTITKSVSHFYAIKTKTQIDAPTGNYEAKVKAGTGVWRKQIRIESIVPNRLDVALTSPSDYLSPKKNMLSLSGKWLYGKATPHYKADISLNIKNAKTEFAGFENYHFTDERKNNSSNRELVWEGSLDEKSHADISLDFSAYNNLQGKANAVFTSRIFEPTGAFSLAEKSFAFSPYERYVGIRLPEAKNKSGILYTDENHTINVALVSETGEKIKNANLHWTLYKLEWKWWWETQDEEEAHYVSSEIKKIQNAGELNIQNGKGSFQINVPHDEWGRYLISLEDEKSGHSASIQTYIDWNDWKTRRTSGARDAANILPLSTDKENYVVGETANISFTAAENSRALIVIEKAGEIISHEWLSTKQGVNVYKVSLTEKMSPNIYVHVSLLQEHLQTANSLPIRMYGILPVLVENPKTVLNPVLTSSKNFEPNKKAQFTVSEKNGKAFTFTLAVVDEGLLGINNFHAPNLKNEFYKKESSLIKTWDIFRYVMNAYSGALETILSIGGSDEIIDTSQKNINRFSPVVQYFGPYELKAGEKKLLEFEMPNYVGNVRAMLVAGKDGAYGTVEKNIPVKANIMALPTLPRVFGENEELEIPVTIFNETNEIQTANVLFSARNAISFDDAKTITIKPNADAIVYFTVKTKQRGTIDFLLSAKTKTSEAKFSESVPVVSRSLSQTNKTSFTLESGKSITVSVASPFITETKTLSLEVSSFPTIDLENRLSYLRSYPHDCLEQTTSKAFPQLYLNDFMKLTSDEKIEIKNNISNAITKIAHHQTSSGGLSYWQGGDSPHAWATCYAAHFLLSAKKQGFAVPEKFFNDVISWIKRSAKNWTKTDYETSEVQAYKLFVLAEAGESDFASMNRLKSENGNEIAKLLLALSFAKSGRTQSASEIFKKVSLTSAIENKTVHSFSSTLRDKAIMLYVANELGFSKPNLAKEIADYLASEKVWNTHELAWSLISLLPYYASQKTENGTVAVLNEKNKLDISFTENAHIQKLVPNENETNTETLTVKNTGSSIVYGTLSSRGELLPGSETPTASGLQLTVRYRDFDGNEIAPETLKKGDTCKMFVSVKNLKNIYLENVSLTIPIPSAWTLETTDDDANATHENIRDEVAYIYFNLAEFDYFVKTFFITKTFDGKFVIPAIHTEAMYDSEMYARKPAIISE